MPAYEEQNCVLHTVVYC